MDQQYLLLDNRTELVFELSMKVCGPDDETLEKPFIRFLFVRLSPEQILSGGDNGREWIPTGGVVTMSRTMLPYSINNYATGYTGFPVVAQEECRDLRGRLIAHGLHYVPGPDTCTLCVCDNGMPKVCKAVLCSPPQDCRSFRVGNTCCEFICLDDVVKPSEGAEANVRLAASGAAAVVLVTVALVVYRVRKQKRRRPPHADDQRSLTSIGYISGSMGYMGGTCETALAAWKPPGNYLPRGEAPPPYDEAVAQCRSEAMSGWSVGLGVGTPRSLARDRACARGGGPGGGRNALMILFNDELMPACRMAEPFHRTFATAVDAVPVGRPDDAPLPCAGHGYVNISRPIQQVANSQGCYNAPLLQQVHPTDAREPQSAPHHPLSPNVVGFPHSHTHGIRLTGSLGAISGRALADPPRPPYTLHHAHTHRTIPRLAGTELGGEFCRERVLVGEVRRSFHRAGGGGGAGAGAGGPAERRLADVATGRSVPRNLNTAAAEIEIEASCARLHGGSERHRARSSEQVQETAPAPPPAPAPAPPPPAQAPPPAPTPPPGQVPPPAPSLPLTVDKPACSCSYAGGCAEAGDDYRSECENCNCGAGAGSRWVQAEADGWMGGEEEGTQTLQRRAPPPAPPPPATATLPQPVTKPRAILGPPSNWENWFNTIPDSDTESEEE